MLNRLGLLLITSILVFSQSAPTQSIPKWVTTPQPERKSNDPKQALRAAEHDVRGPSLEGSTSGHGSGGFAYAVRRESLPFSESNVVIVGSVVSQQPYFNRSHSAVYSELAVKVAEVLKDDNFLNGEQTVTVVRSGGALFLQNGTVVRSSNVESDNHLDIGGKYLLFLGCKSESKACHVLTAWNLTTGKAVPLSIGDILDVQKQKSVFAGMDESTFLTKVRMQAALSSDEGKQMSRISLVFCYLVLAQAGYSQCPTVPSNGSRNSNGLPAAWVPNATVNVYVDISNIPADQRTAYIASIQSALNAWQGRSGSNVTFSPIAQVSGSPLTQAPAIVFQRETPPTAGAAAEVQYNFDSPSNGVNPISTATVSLNPLMTDFTSLEQKVAHEIGHTFGLGECSCEPGQSVMAAGDTMNGTAGLSGPTDCDVSSSDQAAYQPLPPPPSGGSGGDGCNIPPNGGDYYINDGSGGCSPIILDVDGSGYSLTDNLSGVMFDLSATGVKQQLSWTAASSTNSFLVLDRNANGTIDNGGELFGNYTRLADGSRALNGWEALAEFDKPKNGGNSDGVIDRNDAIFSSLRLWQDNNHDGVSQSDELRTLSSLGVDVIHLDYHKEGRRDQSGNVYRYRALIEGHDPTTGEAWHRFAYDIFLTPTN